MVKRKLVINKSKDRTRTVIPSKTSNKLSDDKLKKILTTVKTDTYIKFDLNKSKNDDKITPDSTEEKPTKKKSKVNTKGVTKKDKLRFKKQQLMQKFDTMKLDIQETLKSIGRVTKGNKVVPKEDRIVIEEEAVEIEEKVPLKKDGAKEKVKSVFHKKTGNQVKARKKNFKIGLDTYKKRMKNKQFVENPLQNISRHIRAYVEKETAM